MSFLVWTTVLTMALIVGLFVGFTVWYSQRQNEEYDRLLEEDDLLQCNIDERLEELRYELKLGKENNEKT